VSPTLQFVSLDKLEDVD